MNDRNILALESSTLKQVITKIKLNGQGACFIVTKTNRMIGILTDGDIRKLILSKKKINIKIKNLYNKNFFSLPYETETSVIQQNLAKGIKIIPLLNDSGQIVDYISRTKLKDIPINKPDLNGNEMSYVVDCLKSTFISSQGKYISMFENKFKKFYNMKYALAVSNCTSGLILVLKYLRLKKYDEVIVPNVSFASPINAILHVGAKPVLCDIDEKNFTLCIKSLKKLVTKKTKAIICVHTYGHPCNMDEIKKITFKKNIKIIEDCAESIGTIYKNKNTGTIGDFSVFSFFGNKTLTTGEGGMILFKLKKDFQKCNILRDHGMDPKKKYWQIEVGYNFRMTNIQAAVGLAQTEKIDYLIKEKIKIAEIYNKHLKKCSRIVLPKQEKWAKHSYWLYNILVKDINEKQRDRLIDELKNSGIEVRPMFYPASDMPIYSSCFKNINMKKISYSGISLPSFIGLKEKDIKRITDNITQFIGNIDK